MSVIIFIVILLVLVLVHEWGHFFSAKKFGIKVEEFGFGFPPRAAKLFKKGDTTYTLNWLPIGGFVKIYGENPDEESLNGPDSARSMVNKPRWQQAIVLFAGVFMNFLLAWILFSISFLSGMPTSVQNMPEGTEIKDLNLLVISVEKDSPADLAGIKAKDQIVYIEGDGGQYIEAPYISPYTVQSAVAGSKGGIKIGYLRGKEKTINFVDITPDNKSGTPMIGVAMDQIGTLKLPLHKAIVEGMKLNWSVTKGTAHGLFKLVWDGVRGKGNFSSVTGPVGIVGIVGDAADFGFIYLLSFAALISINLAIINLAPFPALDGGRLLFLLIEKIKGSRLNPKIANTANSIGFALLMLLMLIVTYHDIVKLVK